MLAKIPKTSRRRRIAASSSTTALDVERISSQSQAIAAHFARTAIDGVHRCKMASSALTHDGYRDRKSPGVHRPSRDCLASGSRASTYTRIGSPMKLGPTKTRMSGGAAKEAGSVRCRRRRRTHRGQTPRCAERPIVAAMKERTPRMKRCVSRGHRMTDSAAIEAETHARHQ